MTNKKENAVDFLEKDFLEKYNSIWNSKSFWWRLYQTIWWRSLTVWNGLLGRPTPGEIFLYDLLRIREDLSQKLKVKDKNEDQNVV